ncbi:hypothetical protein [Hymenobacter sp. BT730]|uniref:hypothetical protein n=1 Tax=Hymenobacter sp. BT730 TaxID=3063332 RepID=UPI0026DF51D4|nr:hypothetical protein [Hymenobacter sp. BT730]
MIKFTDHYTPEAGAAQLTATLKALQEGLTSLPLSTAHTNIDDWQNLLEQSGIPALQDVVRELGNLQSLLSSGDLNQNTVAIGRSLSMLGAQTTQAAATATPETRSDLTRLADMLLRAGGDLEGL